MIVDVDELVSRLRADFRQQKAGQGSFAITTFSVEHGQGKLGSGMNSSFVFTQVLMDCLLRLPPNDSDKEELYTFCQKEYKDDAKELENIREFPTQYSSDNALRWYTRQSFFFKILNAALRNQNIHMMFLFRSFIADIHYQLQKHQINHSLKLYRGQLMSRRELDSLKDLLKQFIAINSFLSTTKERSVALTFANNLESKGMEKVLFEIDADSKVATSKPFADISTLSEFGNEAEVLFMLGSIFRLTDIQGEVGQLWVIQMTLCGDDQSDFTEITKYMKNQNGTGETTLQTFAKMLWKMDRMHLAKAYYDRCIKQLPEKDPLLCSVYEDLISIASQGGDLEKRAEWQNKLQAIKQQPLIPLPPDPSKLVKTWNEVNVHIVDLTYRSLCVFCRTGSQSRKRSDQVNVKVE